MIAIQSAIAGLFGLFFGSFLNVINLRFGQWKSIATTRSRCPHCKHQLSWYELIPVMSFVIQQGKCRSCHKKISWQYPIVEIITAITTGLIWYKAMPMMVSAVVQTIGIIIFAYMLILMAVEDSKEMEVAGSLFTSGLIVGLIIALITPHTLGNALLGVVCAAGPLAVLVLISKERWMGWGDVWIAAPIGLILGFPLSIIWLYGAFIIGALWGGGLLVFHLKKRTDPVPFIPILLISFMVTYLWGEMILNWYWKFVG